MARNWFREFLPTLFREASKQSVRRSFRPGLEVLEDRAVPAGLVVQDQTSGLTPLQLVKSLVGAGVTVTGVSSTGAKTQSGKFTGGTGIIGFPSGVILSTGMAKGVIGPNVSDSTTTDFGGAGDSQLTAIAGNPTYDAATLSFNFIPQGSTLKFNFVFGSEEYNEYVDSAVNDLFAFFLNGKNVALVPGTTTPVNIDTVNLGANSKFYINNANALDPSPATGPLLNTEMDGLTVVLPVVAHVNPGVVNHIKLAIADAGDGQYDSNVFIKTGSFSAPLAPKFAAYLPLRYDYHSAQQNGLGQASFDGNVTLFNVGHFAATGSYRLEFHLPAGVRLLNATGTDKDTHLQYITVTNQYVAVGAFMRLPVKLSYPLGAYFDGTSLVTAVLL